MSDTRYLPNAQRWLIQAMEAINLKPDPEMCNGHASVIALAILARRTDFVIELIQLIKSIPPKELGTKIEKAKKRITDQRRWVEKNVEESLADLKTSLEGEVSADEAQEEFNRQKQEYINLYMQDPEIVNLPELAKDIKLLEAHILLSMVKLLFSYKDSDFFNVASKRSQQETTSLFALNLFENIKEEGGSFELDYFINIYTLKDLIKSLELLRLELQDWMHPISIILKSMNHAITIGLDLKKSKQWFFSDSNVSSDEEKNIDRTIEYFETAKELASAIIFAFIPHDGLYKFNTNDKFILSTTISINKSPSSLNGSKTKEIEYLKDIKVRINNWKNHSIHHLTEEKASSTGVWGETLLHFCARQNDIDLAIKLIEKGANVNATAEKLFNLTPLHFSCIENHTMIAEFLLKNKANPNAESSNKHTPLDHACKKNNALLVSLLINNEGKVTQSCLSTVMNTGDKKTLRILEQHCNKVYSQRTTSIFFNSEENVAANQTTNKVSDQIFNLGWIKM